LKDQSPRIPVIARSGFANLPTMNYKECTADFNFKKSVMKNIVENIFFLFLKKWFKVKNRLT